MQRALQPPQLFTSFRTSTQLPEQKARPGGQTGGTSGTSGLMGTSGLIGTSGEVGTSGATGTSPASMR